MHKLCRLGYTLLLYLLSPLLIGRLLWRSRRAPAYRKRLMERWGFCPWRVEDRSLWIHAVSVGETMAAIPLARALLEQYPQYPLIMTTTTPTGSDRVQAALHGRALHAYIPYDLPGAIRRFFKRSRPALLIVMETEIWPGLFHACQQRHIPLLIANARLSARSARRYARLPWLASGLIKPTLACCTTIATQGDLDARRFIDIGATQAQIQVTGNLKFDIPPADQRTPLALELKQLWGRHHDKHRRKTWLAASTHTGEEIQILDAFAVVRQHEPDTLLVIVPRHPERFSEVAELCLQRSYRLARRSQTRGQRQAIDCDIYLGDSMGELMSFFAAADLAFVGGSLIPRGGHNILEAAAIHCPVIFGPHMFNFADISTALLAADGAIQIHDPQALASTVCRLLHDPQAGEQMAARAYRVYEDNRGALPRTLDIIEAILEP